MILRAIRKPPQPSISRCVQANRASGPVNPSSAGRKVTKDGRPPGSTAPHAGTGQHRRRTEGALPVSDTVDSTPSTRVQPHELPASLREAGLDNWIREPL